MLKDKDKWNNVVTSFPNWDIYYLNEYADSFMIHGDGNPILLEYKDSNVHLCYVVMKSDISANFLFKGNLDQNLYFDFEPPYGYGGPLIMGKVLEYTQAKVENEIIDYCRNTNVVSQFVRFHPLLENYKNFQSFFETRYLRDTIYINTENLDAILTNMDGKNRNMVRKAIKNGVTIEQKSIKDYSEFYKMYEETMYRDGADEYYTFHEDYFKSLEALNDNACIFYAVMEGKPIAGSIIYYNDRFAHYHLSGSHAEYRKYAPSNLLLFEAARWASKKGIKKFHLGGGMTPNDSLFGFKKQFNKSGRLPFVVGRTVFDKKVYDELLRLRKKLDPSFDMNNNRLIQYRA